MPRPILLVSGTRPEIIKLAPVYHALRNAPDLEPCWLHTGQHDEMARQMLACFDITPDIRLARRGATLPEFTVGCRAALETVMRERPWSVVVVQGDTESALQGALAAFYNRIPVAHVEAGLRTYNLEQPFPEEAVRQMVARVTRFHFAPTHRARSALVREAIAEGQVHLTGNTVVDAQHWICEHRDIRRRAAGRGRLLLTVHRRENWGAPFAQICAALGEIATRHPDLGILFPVHPNPIVHDAAHALLGAHRNIELMPPLDYLGIQQALADAWLVLTDSGGLQEEASTFGVPLLVLREETERPEAIDVGCARLVGTGHHAIVAEVERLWHDGSAYRQMQRVGNPFGDGAASARIAGLLDLHLREGMASAVAAA